jgi:hypothetical protein
MLAESKTVQPPAPLGRKATRPRPRTLARGLIAATVTPSSAQIHGIGASYASAARWGVGARAASQRSSAREPVARLPAPAAGPNVWLTHSRPARRHREMGNRSGTEVPAIEISPAASPGPPQFQDCPRLRSGAGGRAPGARGAERVCSELSAAPALRVGRASFCVAFGGGATLMSLWALRREDWGEIGSLRSGACPEGCSGRYCGSRFWHDDESIAGL